MFPASATLPLLALAFLGEGPSFGVETDKIGQGPAYRLGDRHVTPIEAREALERGLDDDGQKLRVTLIGPDDVRKSARLAIEAHPEFAELRGHVVLQDFPPDHWAMRAGFVTTGQPTIYCQAPDGTVLHRQDDFAGGAEAAIEALRRARTDYNPLRDLDRRSAPPIARLATLAGAAFAGGVVVRRVRRN